MDYIKKEKFHDLLKMLFMYVSIHIKGNENMMTKAQKFVDLEIHSNMVV